MSDWLMLGVCVAAIVWTIWRTHTYLNPPPLPRWKAPGLGLSVRGGRVLYRSIKR